MSIAAIPLGGQRGGSSCAFGFVYSILYRREEKILHLNR